MRQVSWAICLIIAPFVASADPKSEMVSRIVSDHILPRFEILAVHSQTLSDVAEQECRASSVALRSAYYAAFDSWISASHLRFGPTQTDDRAFALAFWPDSRGITPRVLNDLIDTQDPIANAPEDYAQVSIAGRGFYALEYLLYDEQSIHTADTEYRCQLVQTIAADIAVTARDIHTDWQSNFAALMLSPMDDGLYRSQDEVLQELFKALATGLQFTAETRLGRPLGTFDRPRPRRSEARRSGRSARHVLLSLMALHDLAQHLAQTDQDLADRLTTGFDRAVLLLNALDDPTFASVADAPTRIKVEIVQNTVNAIRGIVRDELGPTLGVAAGFNALDGD
ncbi:imelysin family protein [Aestuariibius sp. HNIBRBA575]|uniref:imelysin family protein n=1 Tax=Aestuariibius sp. HNIBRBA575 TaxID=3233343 RepID=UPI0034A4656F